MRSILSLLLILCGCAAVKDAPEPLQASVVFPEPTQPLVIPEGKDGEWSFDELLRECGRVTSQSFVFTDETLRLLRRTKVPALYMSEIPAESVHSVVESLLLDNGFLLTLPLPSDPSVVSVRSSYTSAKNDIRTNATYVPVDELDRWSQHSAYLIHTALYLDTIDVRTLTNSMRVLITDANLQSFVPAGSTNSVLLTGTAPQVIRLVRMLQEIDESERARFERLAKSKDEDAGGN